MGIPFKDGFEWTDEEKAMNLPTYYKEYIELYNMKYLSEKTGVPVFEDITLIELCTSEDPSIRLCYNKLVTYQSLSNQIENKIQEKAYKKAKAQRKK